MIKKSHFESSAERSDQSVFPGNLTVSSTSFLLKRSSRSPSFLFSLYVNVIKWMQESDRMLLPVPFPCQGGEVFRSTLPNQVVGKASRLFSIFDPVWQKIVELISAEGGISHLFQTNGSRSEPTHSRGCAAPAAPIFTIKYNHQS